MGYRFACRFVNLGNHGPDPRANTHVSAHVIHSSCASNPAALSHLETCYRFPKAAFAWAIKSKNGRFDSVNLRDTAYAGSTFTAQFRESVNEVELSYERKEDVHVEPLDGGVVTVLRRDAVRHLQVGCTQMRTRNVSSKAHIYQSVGLQHLTLKTMPASSFCGDNADPSNLDELEQEDAMLSASTARADFGRQHAIAVFAVVPFGERASDASLFDDVDLWLGKLAISAAAFSKLGQETRVPLQWYGWSALTSAWVLVELTEAISRRAFLAGVTGFLSIQDGVGTTVSISDDDGILEYINAAIAASKEPRYSARTKRQRGRDECADNS